MVGGKRGRLTLRDGGRHRRGDAGSSVSAASVSSCAAGTPVTFSEPGGTASGRRFVQDPAIWSNHTSGQAWACPARTRYLPSPPRSPLVKPNATRAGQTDRPCEGGERPGELLAVARPSLEEVLDRRDRVAGRDLEVVLEVVRNQSWRRRAWSYGVGRVADDLARCTLVRSSFQPSGSSDRPGRARVDRGGTQHVERWLTRRRDDRVLGARSEEAVAVTTRVDVSMTKKQVESVERNSVGVYATGARLPPRPGSGSADRAVSEGLTVGELAGGVVELSIGETPHPSVELGQTGEPPVLGPVRGDREQHRVRAVDESAADVDERADDLGDASSSRT